MIAANDTAPVTIALGTTFESTTWRAHRYSDNIMITSLAGAGKVGKRCEVFTVGGDDLEAVAPVVAWAVQEGATVETMRAMLGDVVLSGLEFSESEKRGVDVPRLPAIVVRGELMRATFTETSALLTFSTVHAAAPVETRLARAFQMVDGGMSPAVAAQHVARKTFKQDTIIGTDKRADAARAYAWAQQNAARLPAMTQGEFRSEMSAIGARFS